MATTSNTGFKAVLEGPRNAALLSFLSRMVWGVLLALILALTWFVYRGGLTGVFLFDDYNNLTALGAMGPIHDWPSFWRYITSGNADPLGRPLSMLSFMLDARNWPADPAPFLRTNVLLHLLNGALLAWAMRLWGEQAGLNGSHARNAALLGAAFWLLHPLFVSTTLYVVQREAMLPATFTFYGIICWCHGRAAFKTGQRLRGWSWSIAGAWLCCVLATLSKANGILLPLLIATAEVTILRGRSTRTLLDRSSPLFRPRVVLLGLPVVLLVVFLAIELPLTLHNTLEVRPWSTGERVLTEPRVLIDYLRLLWLPRTTSFGLFNDQVRPSVDLFHPWTTLPCLLAVVTLCGLGWLMRRRLPFTAFAILFYFAGQLLESTFLSLELAFEHRNYLPAAFMFWPVAIWLTVEGRARTARWIAAAFLIAMLAIQTSIRADVWGNIREQALIWGRINPDSVRAQVFAADVEISHDRWAEALYRLRRIAQRYPDDVQPALRLADAECHAHGSISPETWYSVLYSLKHSLVSSKVVFDWFVGAIGAAHDGTCRGISNATVLLALSAAEHNPATARDRAREQEYVHLHGLLALSNDNPHQALAELNRSLAILPSHTVALEQAAVLGSDGYPELGLQHLDFAQALALDQNIPYGMARIHAWVLKRQHYWENETGHLRATLQADADAKARAKGSFSRPNRL